MMKEMLQFFYSIYPRTAKYIDRFVMTHGNKKGEKPNKRHTAHFLPGKWLLYFGRQVEAAVEINNVISRMDRVNDEMRKSKSNNWSNSWTI